MPSIATMSMNTLLGLPYAFLGGILTSNETVIQNWNHVSLCLVMQHVLLTSKRGKEKQKIPKESVQLPQVCMIQLDSSRSYNITFPPLREYNQDQYKYMLQIPNSTDIDAKGNQQKASTVEAILNWQTQNALAQNSILQRIETKVEQTL